MIPWVFRMLPDGDNLVTAGKVQNDAALDVAVDADAVVPVQGKTYPENSGRGFVQGFLISRPLSATQLNN